MCADIPTAAAAPGLEGAKTGLGNPHKRRVARFFTYLLTLNSTEVPTRDLGKSALVFSPHPDDECLGCGGTIIKKKQAGATIKIVHMTDGIGSHPPRLISKQVLQATREREALNAAGVLGVDDVYFLDFKDQTLSTSIAPAIERVAEIIRKEQPEEVFIPYRREPMRQAADHVAATNIVLSALRSDPSPREVTVWEYPVWFWLHWPWVGFKKGLIGRRYVAINTLRLRLGLPAFLELRYSMNISDVLEKKIAALSEHRTQMTEFIPTAEWTTLGKILGGQWLECFQVDREFFCRSIYQGHA